LQIIKILDYFFVLRPILFFPGWSTLLAGYFIASNKELYFNLDTILQLDYYTISILLISFAASMGASFLLNQLEDIESDLKNKKLFFLAEGLLSPKAVKWEAFILSIFSLYLAYSINLNVLYAMLAFLLITGYAYNYKPFVLKDKPLGSLIANALMGALAFILGMLAVNPMSWVVLTSLLPYLMFNTALYFFTTLPDVAGDKKSKKRTYAVIYGLNFVTNLAIVFFIAAIILAFILQDYFALLFLLPSLIFFVKLFTKKGIENTIKTTKHTLLFFGIAICLKIPFYLIVMIAIFALTKWYFKKRFNYNYPNLKGE